MRFSAKAAALAAALLCSGAQAGEIGELYRGEAIVTGTLEPERSRGLRQILLDVLVKVSAEPRLADDARLVPLLDRAHDLVAGIAYEDRMKGTPVRDEQGTRDRPHDLRATFDKAKIDAALAGLGLKPWAGPRPALRVFVVVGYPAASYRLSTDGQEGLGQKQALAAAASRRGMRVELPLRGEQPEGRAAATDGPAILEADMRWQEPGAYWRTAWTLTAPAASRSWSGDSSSFDEAFRDGIGEAAATLAGRR